MPRKDDNIQVKGSGGGGANPPNPEKKKKKKKILVKKKRKPSASDVVEPNPGVGPGEEPGPSTSRGDEADEGASVTGSEYTEEYAETDDSMADNSKWKGKNLSYMTPAMMHAMKMSQTQSQNNYKKKYNEEVKGKGLTGTETVESARAKKMTAEYSLLKYHSDFEKSKGAGYTAVSDTPEMNRVRGQQTYRDVQYKKQFFEQQGHNIPVVETPESVRVKNQQKLSDIKYQEDRNKLKGKATQVTDDPQMRRAMQAARIASDVEYKKTKEKAEEMERRREEIAQDQQNSKAYKHVPAPGSVLDYDPVMRMQQMSVQDRPKEEPRSPVHAPASPPQSPQYAQPEPTPVPQQHFEEPAPPQPEPVQEQPAEEIVLKGDGHVYRAMYDYSANDDDEVTFQDGDIIINAQKIDEGWMFGTVERTGHTGMLPSNYVEVVQ